MGFFDQKLFQELEAEFDKKVEGGVNFVIVAVPGLGMSYFVRKYIEKKNSQNIKYIDDSGLELGKFNFLDLNFDKNEMALAQAEEYFKTAQLDQKFGLIINTPYLLEGVNYKKSFVFSHVYGRYFFKARDEEDTKIFVKELNENIKPEEVTEIYKMSGGIGRLIKYLVFGETPILDTIVNVIDRCDSVTLERLGILKDGEYVSELLKKHYESRPKTVGIEMEVKPDLSLLEGGEESGKLTKLEASILRAVLGGETVVTKEKISELKWGEGSYDKYSDQAVGKTMQRLNKKLKKYKFEVIIGVGYRIVKKHG